MAGVATDDCFPCRLLADLLPLTNKALAQLSVQRLVPSVIAPSIFCYRTAHCSGASVSSGSELVEACADTVLFKDAYWEINEMT
jgi:hypothetical protein